MHLRTRPAAHRAPATCRAMASPLISPRSLASRLQHDREKPTLLDASWYMPATNRNGAAEFAAGPRLPSARFFDTDAVADTTSPLPHMLPSPAAFGAAMDALGIKSPSSPVVIYDGAGIFSSPRAWFTLLALGHDPGAVAVLDGGLPAYAALCAADPSVPGLETGPADEEALAAPGRAAAAAAAGGAAPPPSYPASLRTSMVRSLDQIAEGVNSGTLPLLMDARPAGRFAGTDPEPRRGLRSGHIPGAASVPFPTLLVRGEADGVTRYKAPEELRAAFKAAAGWDPAGDAPPSPVVFSCGTGVTACILALGAAVAAQGAGKPMQPFGVYDGSWTEWAGRADTPKEPAGGGVLAH